MGMRGNPLADIELRGGRQHNLRSLDITLPQGRLIAIAGPSGAGKSSLAIDTLFAEGQRRFIESLSAYARRFLERTPRPEFDSLLGIGPAISIRPGVAAHNPRSTVGTATEAQDYLRLLFANLSHAQCPICQEGVRAWTTAEAVDLAWGWGDGCKFSVLAPLGGDDKTLSLAELRGRGFVRARIAGIVRDLDQLRESLYDGAEVDLIIDRLSVRASARSRCAEAIDLARSLGAGVAVLAPADGGAEQRLSMHAQCPNGHPGVAARSVSLFSFNSPEGACATCGGTGRRAPGKTDEDSTPCAACSGRRFNASARAYGLAGRSLDEVMALSLEGLLQWLDEVQPAPSVQAAVGPALEEVRRRVRYLDEVGLGYLTLARSMDTLSPGEVGRVRLASQMGAGLSGVLYVLDEPSAGLHARDVERLLAALTDLRDRGNTVLIVEHNIALLRASDHLVELGPGAGVDGGRLIGQGAPEEVLRSEQSVTGMHLRERRFDRLGRKRRRLERSFRLCGASTHNLKGEAVEFPLGVLVGVTGVSGSGKSALVMDTLLPALKGRGAPHIELDGITPQESRVIAIDQAPLGKNSRSNPASACGFLSDMRTLFAGVPDARARGYKAGRFSYNVKAGRCQACDGFGFISVPMHFLPDSQVPCDECGGARFNRETLEIRYRGHNFAEILELSVEEARSLFASVPTVSRGLDALRTVGLGYLKLGMPANQLSGGESQRVKIARELAKKPGKGAIYIMDEPTSGLHVSDIGQLVDALGGLVSRGHSVIAVEHNLQLIAECDYLIDMGPEGGEGGGRVIASGSPEAVASDASSITGAYLKPFLTD